MPWTDSHCHVPYEGLDNPAEVVALARDAGVTRMITVGTDAEQSQACIDVARIFDGVWATVGLHPHDAKHGVESIVDVLADGLSDGSCVAIGECGLDYHYDHSPRDVQRSAFEAQVALANKHDLALVIHTRDAWDDTWAILRNAGMPPRTVFHCFTGGAAEAEVCLELGASLSFSGIVTFKRADDVRDAARRCPLDRLLVETDSPYLTPEPHRGRQNTPALVPLIGEAVAVLHGVATERVEVATTDNASRLFGLPRS